ncbi:AraC family transcriptional regulator [Noviherbaspirillum aerium]|uniref:AraC family transcriptional regulator n=1 Tax=Noviherbaspirillum aerium TaxID=2588497 RepID=UPI00124D6FBB|nr:helix-turn-helix transcriptional regulator [Noviherbaspirillum aerium]
MKTKAKHLFPPQVSGSLPVPVYFRSASVPANAATHQHHHACGELVYSFSGLMEVKLANNHYLALPQYGIWLPPYVEHVGLNRYETSFCSVYIAEEFCAALPRTTCAITVNPLVRAILEHLRDHPPAPEAQRTEEDDRLLRVLLDQIVKAEYAGSYLPTSDDPVLGPVLQALEANPGDTRTLPELARQANTTERTLIRRCQRELGMSLAEWRQRLRVVKAMPLLEAGRTVESIALDLGYGSASAFITMFRRMAGMTPDECRKGG